MSQVIWANTRLPEPATPAIDLTWPLLGVEFGVANTRSLSGETATLVALPDKKAYRSMTRAAVMLSSVGLPAKEILAPFLERDAFRVGLYCAIENGSNDYVSCANLLETSGDNFAAAYKKLRNPKQYLKQLPNLAAAQLGIFLEIMGTMNVYTHSQFACVQALENAEWDLQDGAIDAALVCSSFSLEDPLLCMRERRRLSPEICLSEGAAAMVMVKSANVTKWTEAFNESKESYFGISDTLISTARRFSQHGQ